MALNDDYLSFFLEGSFHHLYYLLPFAKCASDRQILCFCHHPKKASQLLDSFKEVAFRFIQLDDRLKKQIQSLCSLKKKRIILHPNTYNPISLYFLQQDVVNVFVLHGMPQKMIQTAYYKDYTILDSVIIPGIKTLKQLLKAFNLELEQIKIIKNIEKLRYLTLSNKRGVKQFILGGNLRVRGYLENRPMRALLQKKYKRLDQSKKTILYMPTHSTLQYTKGKDLCSINYFFDYFLPQLKNKDAYNYIIKPHPNILYNPRHVERLNYFVLNQPNVQLEAYSDSMELMDIADVMIVDQSSAAHDFLYFDKPILFLDIHNDLRDGAPEFEAIMNPFWHFPMGEIINEKTIKEAGTLLEENLKNDHRSEIRKKYKDYSFQDDLSVNQILDVIRTHPKYG